jgi:hypothetical protein
MQDRKRLLLDVVGAVALDQVDEAPRPRQVDSSLVIASWLRKGSSRIMTFGLLIMARASSARRCMPPESCSEYLSRKSCSPTLASRNSPNSRVSRVSSPRARGP